MSFADFHPDLVVEFDPGLLKVGDGEEERRALSRLVLASHRWERPIEMAHSLLVRTRRRACPKWRDRWTWNPWLCFGLGRTGAREFRCAVEACREERRLALRAFTRALQAAVLDGGGIVLEVRQDLEDW